MEDEPCFALDWFDEERSSFFAVHLESAFEIFDDTITDRVQASAICVALDIYRNE